MKSNTMKLDDMFIIKSYPNGIMLNGGYPSVNPKTKKPSTKVVERSFGTLHQALGAYVDLSTIAGSPKEAIEEAEKIMKTLEDNQDKIKSMFRHEVRVYK